MFRCLKGIYRLIVCFGKSLIFFFSRIELILNLKLLSHESRYKMPLKIVEVCKMI